MTKPLARNHFRPSFGMSPLYLAGRADWIRQFQLSLFEPGNPLRVSLISGPRGIGKTVLLNEFEDTASSYGWVVLRASPRPNMIHHLMETVIPTALNKLLDQPATKRKISSLNIAGVGGISLESHAGVTAKPTLNTMLRDLLDKVEGIFITIDEVQSAPIEPMHELTTTIQDLRRDELNIAFAGAGLQVGIDELLTHEGMTFLRRAEMIQLTMVPPQEVANALSETMADSQKQFIGGALQSATALTHGYPYLIQTVGSLLWAQAEIDKETTITDDTVAKIKNDAIVRIGHQVHRPALVTISERELTFLLLMAELGPQPVSTATLAEKMGLKANAASQVRAKLLGRELIEAPARGVVDFTLPYMREYLQTTFSSADSLDTKQHHLKQ